MKTKVLISFAVTVKLICAFVLVYAECWFSHELQMREQRHALAEIPQYEQSFNAVHLCLYRSLLKGFLWPFWDAAYIYMNLQLCGIGMYDNLSRPGPPGPEVIKLLSCSTQLSMKFQMHTEIIKICRKFRFT